MHCLYYVARQDFAEQVAAAQDTELHADRGVGRRLATALGRMVVGMYEPQELDCQIYLDDPLLGIVDDEAKQREFAMMLEEQRTAEMMLEDMVSHVLLNRG